MHLRSIRFPLALFVVAGLSAWVHGVRSGHGLPSAERAEPVIIPHLMEAVRVPGVAVGSVLVANASDEESTLVVESITLEVDGAEIAYIEPYDALVRDIRYARAQAMIERLPAEWTHRHGAPRVFADEKAHEFAGEEALARWQELDALVLDIHEDESAGLPMPFAEPKLSVPYDQVFAPWDPPGSTKTIAVRVRWRRGQGASTDTVVPHQVRLLTPLPDEPIHVGGSLVTLHPGDLHVHSCHGEAAGACAPSANCAAESLQLTGSFSYAELRTQFEALGYDWFTATDHSYCINSDAEFAQMDAECAALTDANFLVPMDMELSSAETGSQSGGDASNILCLFGSRQNHMGAHALQSRISGGSDGFAGFCNGVADFDQNATTVNAQGGFGIVHHPSAGSFGWNSRSDLQGLESRQLHGVEIWNGAAQSGQGGDVADWVDWLLDGRILYAYSGSDTHDSAFDFGANFAVFRGEPFTEDGLFSVLRRGRSFISNGPVAILEADFGGTNLQMGALQSLSPSTTSGPVDLSLSLELGATTADVTLFRGRVGDAAETVVAMGAGLTGSTTFSASDTLDPLARTWYRAYVEAADGTVAYTNPIFFLPSTCVTMPYGVGVGGTNTATLSSDSSPAIGSEVTFDFSGFPPSTGFCLFVYSFNQIAPFAFGGGFLLVAPPYPFQMVVPLSSSSGSATLSLPLDDSLIGTSAYLQAGAPTGSPGTFVFTNGLAVTICDLLQ